MKILITGHKGFIGSHFYKAFPNAKVFDISDFETYSIRPVHLDISGFDWVIHCGAISSTTESDIRKIMDLNLSWSIELLQECIKYDVGLQFSSSASVYGKVNSRTPIKESHPTQPLNYYACSKLLFEQHVENIKPHIPVQIFRYFNVYGDGENHKGSQASPYTQFKKQAIENGCIKIFRESERFERDFIHVDEVVKIQSKFLDKKSLYGVFNVGSGITKSFRDVAVEVSKECGVPMNCEVPILEIPFPSNLKPHYQEYTCADMTKTMKALS